MVVEQVKPAATPRVIGAAVTRRLISKKIINRPIRGRSGSAISEFGPALFIFLIFMFLSSH